MRVPSIRVIQYIINFVVLERNDTTLALRQGDLKDAIIHHYLKVNIHLYNVLILIIIWAT